jgi:iron-hydrogenase subunit gamma
MFKLEPQGPYQIQVCEGLSCYLVGGRTDHRPRERTPEYQRWEYITGWKILIEIVQCLAACDLAPAIKVNDELYGNMTAAKIDALLAKHLQRGRDV